MFGIGTTELVVILVVALLVLGPKKLPEIARSLGKTLGEFRRVTTDVKRTIEMEADQEEEVKARKRIKQEMARKASRQQPAETQPGDSYPEAEIPREPEETPHQEAKSMNVQDQDTPSQDTEPEPDKKSGPSQ